DPRLFFDRHHAQPSAEQLLDQVVLLVVDRGPAEGADAAYGVEQVAGLVAFGEVGVARGLDAAGDLVQRPVQRLALPAVGVGRAVQDVGDAVRVDGQLEGVGPLGAEGALVDGAFGVALDVDDPAAFGVDELPAADGTVGANTLGHGGAAQPRGLR